MSDLVGTLPLVRLALRRDRLLLPVWIAVFVVTAASSASAAAGLYPTLESRVSAADGLNASTALVALYGRIYDPTSIGALAMFKLSGLGAALVAVLATITVVRHTRAEEEAGRLELLGATVVGRQAALAAALVVATGTNLVLGALTALALVIVGLPAAGSVAFGLAWAGAGIAFAAVAAVAAQLTTGARAAIAATGALLAATYVVRAVGDAADTGRLGWISWLSLIGWTQQVRPFAGDRWAVLVLLLAFTALAVATAHTLLANRDLGAGLLADRPGRASASSRLRSSLGLAWRLQRPLLLGWAAGFLLLGAVLGGIAANVGDLLDSPQAADLIRSLGGEKTLSDAYLAAEMGFVGVFTAVFAVQAVTRLRAEETSIHAEALLATAVGRARWAGGHLSVAVLGSAGLLVTAGLSAGIAHAAQTGDAAQVGRVLAAALVQLPATVLFAGIALAAFGVAPRFSSLAWAALVGALLLGELGPLFDLDQRVLDLSPFAHVPKLPGGDLAVVPVVALLAVGATLVAVGLVALRHRDIG